MITNNSAPSVSVNEVSTLDATTTSNVNPTPNNEPMNTQSIEVILPSYRPYPMPAALREAGHAPCDEYGYPTMKNSTYGILATERDTAPWPVKLPNSLKQLLALAEAGCTYKVSETWTKHYDEVLEVKEYVIGTYASLEWNGKHWVCLGYEYNADGTPVPYDQPSVFRSADNITIVTNVTIIPPVPNTEVTVVEDAAPVEEVTVVTEESITVTPTVSASPVAKKSRFSFLFKPVTLPWGKKSEPTEVLSAEEVIDNVVTIATAGLISAVMVIGFTAISVNYLNLMDNTRRMGELVTRK